MGNNFYEIKRCRLTTISPVYIGSVEQRLTPFEYIYNNERIYFISDERLSQFLKRKNLIEPYVSAVSTEGPRFRLSHFLKDNGIAITEMDLLDISSGRYAYISGDISKLQDFRPFIRDGFGEIFIPGSSLKGVFKTAVLFAAMKKLKEERKEDFNRMIENKIENDILNNKKKKYFFQWGMEKWFESFILNKKKDSPNTDWFRMLHVTDAYPVEEVKTYILPIYILKKERSGWKIKTERPGENTVIWAECIPAKTVFEFQISWDNRLLEDFKKQNNNIELPENLNRLNENLIIWSKDTKEFEEKFSIGYSLHNWYEKNNPNFRIGFGSGMVSTTIIQLLTESLRKRIRNFAGLDRGDDEAPKSRRVWINNNQAIPLGWAVLEFLSFDPKQPLFTKQTKIVPKKDINYSEIREEEKALSEVDKTIDKKECEQKIITNVILSYNPGNRSLKTTVEGKQAFVEHIDDKFVPEHLWPKLKKDRKIKATIVIEPVGNAFKIVSVKED
ncbi:MAG: type III-A CRISPR-associated RAMP protein Csm5 [Syntrophorhabdaceae bacterium]|nr:type III-A CRISPR-associated RAMP protein Csm5 [Syntrophorhabdaceae bacterium]